MAAEKIFGVGELTRRIKALLEDSIGPVWVEGEISNVRRPQSGHLYFTLKDETAQLRAVMFRGNQTGMRVELRDGVRIRAFGEISVYERDGAYQIIVRRVVDAGAGALQARFEALKEKLLAEGLFDAGRKRALPMLPRCVGIVTSPTGAAIRDILNVLARRFPNLHILIAPARVQGEGAAAEIAAGLDLLNTVDEVDVIIAARGGGSLEDLWSFNEEVVARAVARSRAPVISAVGHEVDFTISDFVADVRAPTPSAAAELVVGRKDAFEDRILGVDRRLRRALGSRVLECRNRLLSVVSARTFERPKLLVNQFSQRIDGLAMRMERCMGESVTAGRRVLEQTSDAMRHTAQLRVQRVRQDLRRLEAQLRALDPLAVLTRGYSVTMDEERNILKDPAAVRDGQGLITRLAAGEVRSVARRGTPDTAG